MFQVAAVLSATISVIELVGAIVITGVLVLSSVKHAVLIIRQIGGSK